MLPLKGLIALLNTRMKSLEGALTKLLRRARGEAWVTDFGSQGNGASDEFLINAFQKAHDSLPANGGSLIVPAGDYLLDGATATISAPKVLCKITKNNVSVICSKGANFHMANWDQTTAVSAGTDSTSQDCFKAFSFRDGVVGGVFRGGNFTGDSDGTILNTGPRPRAVAVAIDGASDIDVIGVTGTDIVGNLVNARGDNAGAGVPSQCRRVRVHACRATSCAEDGFNFMGGTYDCEISYSWGISNLAAGFESGTREGLVCDHNHFLSNKNGISHVGNQGVFTGNILRLNTVCGLNFQYQDASFDGADNVVSGGIISENLQAGIIGDASTSGNTIGGGVRIYDNGTGTGEGIKLQATCTRYTIDPCSVYDSGAAVQKYGIHAITASDLSIKGVTTWGNITNGLLVESTTDKVRITDNDFGDTVTIAATTTNRFIRNNRGYVTENSGTATIASGTTSIVVSHGLSTGGVTTSAAFQVTPTNSLGLAAKFWISAVTSTQFTINVNVDPGAATATFVWSASVQA